MQILLISLGLIALFALLFFFMAPRGRGSDSRTAVERVQDSPRAPAQPSGSPNENEEI